MGRIEVAVLGPTVVDGRSVTPGQRRLVAALALADETGVSVDQLADAVWSGHPPASARSSLHNQVTRLRREFGDEVIDCDQGRFRLVASIDAVRFERAIAPAMAGVVERATLTALADGLSLWRAEAYEDLGDHQRADVERARLHGLRVAAATRLGVAELGRDAPAAAEAALQAPAEAAPFDERLWELLVIARAHAAGRDAALATYRSYVERLRAELGVEPTGALRRIGRDLVDGVLPDLPVHRQPLGPEPSTGRPAHRCRVSRRACSRPTRPGAWGDRRVA